MVDGDPQGQIAQLEAHIEELAETIKRCAKITLFSKIAVVASATWFLGIVLGAVAADPLALIGAISAVIGGAVIYGSNTATAKQILAEMKNAEVTRHELISALGLRVVGDGASNHEQ